MRFILLIVFFCSCVPAQVINKKSETEVVEVVREPLVSREDFIYQQASGRVDLGIIADNSQIMNNIGLEIKENYRLFLRELGGYPHLLFQGNIVETPAHQTGHKIIRRDVQGHFESVYPFNNGHLFGRFHPGPSTPFQSTLRLFGNGFNAKDISTPLFLLYIIGSDSAFLGDDLERIEEIIRLKELISTRPYHKIYIASNRKGECSIGEIPTNFQQILNFYFPASIFNIEHLDLCQRPFNFYRTPYLSDIIAYKKRMILAQKLPDNALMNILANNSPLIKESHYRFYEEDNEIILLSPSEQLIQNKKELPPVGSVVSVKYLLDDVLDF